MAAGHRSPPSQSRSTDRNLEEAQCTGCLDLSNRKLTEIPKAIDSYDLYDTVDTNISKNRLTEIPKEICDFALLEKLNCYHNSIRSLPESITRLQYLTYLDISRNQLSHLPPFLSELKSLEVLLVSNNRLVSIPEELSHLQSLMEMDVSCNEITILPCQIGDLVSLKILNLRKNLLQELPAEISRLKLKTLNFSCNKIQAIPIEFRQMETLEDMVLDNNPLISPPAHTCTKGRVHILKYLHILAAKEDKRRGVAGENNLNRSTLHRSFQREEKESVRMRRKAVMSTDSGYCTDIPNRWPSTVTAENGFDGGLSMQTSEQRAERHHELQKRISQAELHSPSRNNLNLPATASSTPRSNTPEGTISPLKVGPGSAVDGDEDIFARELSRQKQEYEQKKKRAEQIRSDARRLAKAVPQSAPSSAISTPSSKPPQPPMRSSSANAPSRTLLYSEQPSVRPNHLSLRQHSLPTACDDSESVASYSSSKTANSIYTSPSQHTVYSRHSSKDQGEHNSNGYPTSTQTSAVDSVSADKSVTESVRSSPISLSSQDDDVKSFNSGPGKDTTGKGRTSRSGNEVSKRHTREALSDFVQRKLRSRSSPSMRERLARPVAVSNSAEASSESIRSSRSQLPTGKIGSYSYKAIKSQGRSKTAPLPSQTSTQGTTTLNSSSPGNDTSSKLPVKTDRTANSHSRLQQPQSISKFGFQQGVGGKTPSPLATSTSKVNSSVNGHHPDDTEVISQLKELIENKLKVKLPTDLMAELRDGVVLCHLANHVKPRTVSQIHVKSSAVPKLSMAKCKRNVDNFIDACRRLGVPQDNLCCNSDIIEDKNPLPLLLTVKSLLEIKLNNKMTNGGHSSNHRSTSTPKTPTSHMNRSTTPTSRRSHQPLHSVV